MALVDLRKRGKKKAGTTWINSNNKIIQARPGTKEKVGDDISKHRKKTTTPKRPVGGQGGRKSRYSGVVKKNKNRESLLSKIGTRIKNAPSRWKKRLTPKPKKKKKAFFADTTQWD